MNKKIRILVVWIVMLLTVYIEVTFGQPTLNTNNISNNDKKIWNLVYNKNNQMEQEIKQKDSLSVLFAAKIKMLDTLTINQKLIIKEQENTNKVLTDKKNSLEKTVEKKNNKINFLTSLIITVSTVATIETIILIALITK
jgi:hypothetical protein